MKLFERLERLPKTIVLAGIAITTLLVAIFDFVTTTDVSAAAFYLVPISLAAVTLGGHPALGVAADQRTGAAGARYACHRAFDAQ